MQDGGPCAFSSSRVRAQVSNVYEVEPTETALQTVVAVIGPVSVAIAVTPNFQNYRGGNISKTSCRFSFINLLTAFDNICSSDLCYAWQSGKCQYNFLSCRCIRWQHVRPVEDQPRGGGGWLRFSAHRLLAREELVGRAVGRAGLHPDGT